LFTCGAVGVIAVKVCEWAITMTGAKQVAIACDGEEALDYYKEAKQ
jgi:hypothetical protein